VRVTAKELVERFSVSASCNRLWPAAESTVVSTEFSKEPFTFCVSFYDTGWQTVVFTAYKTNAASVTDSLHVYCTSPLHQDSLLAFDRDSVALKTPAVRDRNVTYYWGLGASVRYSSPLCSTRVVATAPHYTGRGSLWVGDGRFSSPADSFAFFLRDTVRPVIACVNEELVSSDTIYTSDSIFTFKARIADSPSGPVDSASVNGQGFDAKTGDVYYKIFDRVYAHTAANPLALSVYCLDHFQNGNAARKTFWLVFSKTLPHAKKARIVVLTPAFDTVTVTAQPYFLSGRIENNSPDPLSLSLFVYVNNSVSPLVRSITGAAAAWDWLVPLLTGQNTVRIIGVDNKNGDVLDWKELLLLYTPDAPDTLPPRILDILADGRPAQDLYTSKSSVVLSVRALDDGSGIDTLFINGRAAAAQGLWYFDTLPLAHTQAGNEAAVVAVDRRKNAARQTAVIFKNNPPVLQKWPRSAFIKADSAYTDTLRAVDPDNDTLIYQRTEGPAGLFVGQNGLISWTPATTDTGGSKVTIRIWDGYQPVFVTFMLYVSLPGQPPPRPVSFATRAEDFPAFLVAGKDTLKMSLSVTNGSGIPPFAFTARIVGMKPLLLNNSSDSSFTWAPLASDTGYKQIIAVVKDQFPSTDTLYPRVLVVPPDRPCSISVSYAADTLSNGAIDLNSHRRPFTMVFRVHDPDNPLSERHSVSLFDTRTRTASVFDSALIDTFVYSVDPAVFTGYDTIVASVREKSNADTIRVRLYFGTPPDAPAAVSPLNYAIVNTASVALSFSGHDPDSDTLTYDVYFGTSPVSLSLAATTQATTYTVYGLASNTTYYWRVNARDWKSQTPGQLWQFTTGLVN
jgi:hypothetical protein